MNIIFILICIIILVSLYFHKFYENFDVYNFNQPYYIKDKKYGYFLLVDSNLQVYWDYSFSNMGTILFNNPTTENQYIPIQKSIQYGSTTDYLYSQGEKLNFTPYNYNNQPLFFDKNSSTIQSFKNNVPNYLIINQNGSFVFTLDQSKASTFVIITKNDFVN